MSSKRKTENNPTIIIDISDFKDAYSFVRHDRETNTEIYLNKLTGEEVQLIKYEFFENSNPLHINVKNGMSSRKIHSKLKNGKKYFNKFLEQTGLSPVTNLTSTELNPTLDYFWKIHKNIGDGVYMGYENFDRVSKRSMLPVSRRVSNRVYMKALQPEHQVAYMQNMHGQQMHQGPHEHREQIHKGSPIYGQPMSGQQIHPGMQMTVQQMQQMQGRPMQNMQQIQKQPIPIQSRQPTQRHFKQPINSYNDEDLGYFYTPSEDIGYSTRVNSRANTRANSPEPQLQSVGGGEKIKDKAKKYFYKLLVDPKTIYLKYKEHLYIKFNNYLLSVEKLKEYIYSKDIKQVKIVKKIK